MVSWIWELLLAYLKPIAFEFRNPNAHQYHIRVKLEWEHLGFSEIALIERDLFLKNFFFKYLCEIIFFK
jgi:hypothetical protein